MANYISPTPIILGVFHDMWYLHKNVFSEFVVPQFISTADLEMCARGPQATPSVKPFKYWGCYEILFLGLFWDLAPALKQDRL